MTPEPTGKDTAESHHTCSTHRAMVSLFALDRSGCAVPDLPTVELVGEELENGRTRQKFFDRSVWLQLTCRDPRPLNARHILAGTHPRLQQSLPGVFQCIRRDAESPHRPPASRRGGVGRYSRTHRPPRRATETHRRRANPASRVRDYRPPRERPGAELLPLYQRLLA